MTNTPIAEIGLVDYHACQLAMIHGMTDMLRIAGDLSEAHGGGRLRISHWRLRPDGGMARSYDTHEGQGGTPAVLVVPGALIRPLDADEAAPYARWLLDRHAQGAVLGSVCGGAFVLAATGLLGGRPATTHWTFANAFRDRFPDVRLDIDKAMIDDGDIVTAGGMLAWTDLALRLIDRLLGPTVMVETARYFLVDPGGRDQRHFGSFSPRLTHGDAAILQVQHWLQQKQGHGVGVAAMAAQARLEERTFLRRFRAATGLKPTEYAQNLRVAKARELLEFTNSPVDRIAWSVGYEDPGAFRKVFHRIVGLSPGDYRNRFGTTQRIVA